MAGMEGDMDGVQELRDDMKVWMSLWRGSPGFPVVDRLYDALAGGRRAALALLQDPLVGRLLKVAYP
jgi:hypothetical protein